MGSDTIFRGSYRWQSVNIKKSIDGSQSYLGAIPYFPGQPTGLISKPF
jgi:hypothetical protein